MTAYRVYDVFTDHAFGGNPLAVIPDATALPDAMLQKIAREFNFSETTFVYSPDNPAHTAKVRIFTPNQEIAFAGHPTIGTAIALHDLGHTGPMILELGIGPIPCNTDDTGASFTTSVPLEILSHPAPDLVARALGLPLSAIDTTAHMPVQATLGLAITLVALKTRDDLRACLPATDAIREGAILHPAGLDFALFPYVRDSNQIDARMFAPLDNIPEDPATGSACATLAALLAQTDGAPVSLNIRQGDDMGRPSRITASTASGAVTIAGQAVLTMEGRLVL